MEIIRIISALEVNSIEWELVLNVKNLFGKCSYSTDQSCIGKSDGRDDSMLDSRGILEKAEKYFTSSKRFFYRPNMRKPKLSS